MILSEKDGEHKKSFQANNIMTTRLPFSLSVALVDSVFSFVLRHYSAFLLERQAFARSFQVYMKGSFGFKFSPQHPLQ